MRVDPRVYAARGDLADVRLAERVFAPHYAAAMPCSINHAAGLWSKPVGGERVGDLAAGDLFELLELTDKHGWGVAPRLGLVGYCARDALECVRDVVDPA